MFIAIGQNFSGRIMATMRYTQSAREMIPRRVFSIRFLLELFTTERVERKGRKKQDRRAEIDHVQHNVPNGQRRRERRDNAVTYLFGVNLRPQTLRIRGSPFQLPTRLAVGLGLESGLEISCLISFAPSSLLRILGLPCPAPGRKSDLGCNGDE